MSKKNRKWCDLTAEWCKNNARKNEQDVLLSCVILEVIERVPSTEDEAALASIINCNKDLRVRLERAIVKLWMEESVDF